MPTWRDDWAGPPGVVVIAETPATEEGVIEDALLFVLDGCASATIFDTDKRAHTIALPPEAQEGSYMGVGLDIVLTAPNPTPHPKESP